VAYAYHSPPEVSLTSVTGAAERPLPKVLDLLARSAFRVGRLEPVPGWQFGQWDRRDPRAWARRLVWQVAQSCHYDGPITTDWYLGLRFNHHLAGDISRCTYVDGRYEPNEMFAMTKLLGPGMCIVDAGANEGLFTIIAARIAGGGGVVHSFEPSPRERSRLEANIAINRLTNVKVHSAALGRAAGRSTLRIAGAGHSGHNTLGGFMYAGTVHEESVEVDVVTLDQAVEEQKLARLDLLKIDVEGSEAEVLRGADGVLRKMRPVVIAEAQEASLRQMGSSAKELMDLLRSHDYTVKAFGPSGEPGPPADAGVSSQNLLCLPNSRTRAPSRRS
jgi:FkbM family methyltransferase